MKRFEKVFHLHDRVADEEVPNDGKDHDGVVEQEEDQLDVGELR